jgi:hypothetical protein
MQKTASPCPNRHSLLRGARLLGLLALGGQRDEKVGVGVAVPVGSVAVGSGKAAAMRRGQSRRWQAAARVAGRCGARGPPTDLPPRGGSPARCVARPQDKGQAPDVGAGRDRQGDALEGDLGALGECGGREAGGVGFRVWVGCFMVAGGSSRDTPLPLPPPHLHLHVALLLVARLKVGLTGDAALQRHRAGGQQGLGGALPVAGAWGGKRERRGV